MRSLAMEKSRTRRIALVAILGALSAGLVVSCSLPGGLDSTDMRNFHRHKTPGTDTVQLSWNANSETNLAGYKLYMGTASGAYGSPTTLGLVTTTNVTTLVPGTTYYFALSAFDTAGQESAKTAQLTYQAP